MNEATLNTLRLTVARTTDQIQRQRSSEIAALKRYIRGQRVLAAWINSHDHDIDSALLLVYYSQTPELLYFTLDQLGYEWKPKVRLWRLMPGLNEPRPLDMNQTSGPQAMEKPLIFHPQCKLKD